MLTGLPSVPRVSEAQAFLQRLLPPLRYASRDGFKHIHTLKGFEGLVLEVCKEAVKAGLSPDVSARLIHEVRGFDTMGHASRVNALRVLVGELATQVSLPPELQGVGLQPKATGALPPEPPQPPPPPKPMPVQQALAPAAKRPLPAPPARPSPMGEGTASRPAVPSPHGGGTVADRRQGEAPRPKQNALPIKGTKAKKPPPGAEPEGEEETAYVVAPPKVPTVSVTSGPLASPLKSVAKVHSRLQSVLNKKGLAKAGDVLYLMPRTYEDRRKIGTLASLRPGERGSAIAEVQRVEETFRGRRMLKVIFGDHTGSISGTFFQFGNWLKAKFPVGKRFLVSGELRATPYGRDITHPEVEPADDWLGPMQQRPDGMPPSIHFERIVPIYPGFERGEQRTYRELANKVVEQFTHTLEDPLPEPVRQRVGLPKLAESLRELHFPGESAPLERMMRWSSPYHQRLAFDELFFLQLGLSIRRAGVKVEPGIAFQVDEGVLGRATGRLPFKLTGAQGRALAEIASDMAKGEPMNRLLQGDVGSGKTAVALCAALVAIENGYQAAVMAPTEILAEQHARTLRSLCSGAGIEVGLVVGAQGAKERKVVRERLAQGKMQLVVGTHALLEGDVNFGKLGLVVIDEQHRFGVMQRAALMAKGTRPDVLVMTATPIPRTLAMAAYGDLDLSIIDELPPGRTPIVTKVYDERRRDDAYQLMAKELLQGRQAYVIFPLVEESEKLDLLSATEGAEKVQAAFPGYRVGLLHGRMKPEEKDEVMRRFRDKEVHILVSTTVVEVGVDVPNATVMLIESAERFGLSQLHQLRGRVGRGGHASHCLLLSAPTRSHLARERLGIMEQSTDGFVIAQKDLELRGPGEFLGTRQSGLPELAVANLARDQELLVVAKREALAIVNVDHELRRPEHQGLRRALLERWEGKLALAKIG